MQGIIIQGPTTYCKEIIDCYQDIPNVVFSTWDTEPQENIDYIKSKNIEVIQLPEPSPSGHLNINYQTLSTFNGIQYLKNKDVTEGLKIRSDYYINDLKLLLSILKNKPLSFLSICKLGIRPLYYELGYTHTSFDFPIDHIVYGTLNNLEKCFDFQLEENIPIPPEALIAYSYFSNSNLEFQLDYNTFIKNDISFFMNDCINNNISITLLKEKYAHIKDMIKLHSDKTQYEY
jgi:hypothetical protein